MERLRVASLFTGCGGMDLGMQGGFTFLGKCYTRNPVNMVFANDADSPACEIFTKNFSTEILCRDIKDVPSPLIPDHDILMAGFPCQPFSIVAQNPPRIGLESPMGWLFMEVNRVIRDKKPACFIAENVKGILSANGGKAFPMILDEFRKAGYRITYKIVNSVNFGVPQRRERVFIVGFRNDLGIDPRITEPLLGPIPLKKILLKPRLVDDKYYFSEKAVNGLKRSRENHPEMNKGRVQDRNQPSSTMTAHLSKASLNSMDPVLKEGDRYRRIVPKEVARIQSFPDDFVLTESDRRQYIALGNAVPPVMMWHISKQIIRQIQSARRQTGNATLNPTSVHIVL